MARGFAGATSILLSMALLATLASGCTKQMRKARWLARADKDFAAERYDRAEVEYSKALQFPPLDPRALSQLGIICYEQGRWASAIVYLGKAVELQPTYNEARIKLGLAGLPLYRFGAAHEQALKVLASDFENPEALLLLAGCCSSSEQLAQAEVAFDKVSAPGRNKPGYHLARGALYLRERSLTNALEEYRQELAIDPKSSKAYEALASLFLANQDLKQAEAALKQGSELAPLHSGARLAYADFRFRGGATNEAVQSIQELAKKAPDFLPASLFLARAALAQGKSEECFVLLRQVLAQDPSNFDALSMNGSLLLAKGDGTNAAGMFERFLSIYSPGSPQIHYELALAYTMNNELDKAAASLNRALILQTNYPDAILLQAKIQLRQGDSHTAIASLSRLVELQPQLPQAYLTLASAYNGQHKYDEAAAVYRRMMGVFTNSAEVPFNLGMVLLAQNRTNDARQAFERSLSAASDFLPSIQQLIELDLNEDRAAAATERVNQLVEKYPKVPQVQVLRARIHIHQAEILLARERQKRAGAQLNLADIPAAADDVRHAEEALLKALELSPNFPPACQLLALVYADSNREQQAMDQLKGLLSRTNEPACLMELAVIQQKMKDYPAARESYERLLKSQPENAEALNNLAVLDAEEPGQLAQGFQFAERARQLRPDSPAIADTLGWLVYRRGDYSRALTLLEEAEAKLPESGENQFHLGMVHYMRGEEAVAKTALQHALQSGQRFRGIDEAIAAAGILAIEPGTASNDIRVQLEQRLREVPKDPIALQRLAAIQERHGQLPDAMATYQRAHDCLPKEPRLAFKLAQLYRKSSSDSGKALELAKSAHLLAPDDSSISALLGRLAFESGDYQWAASLLQDSARKQPADPEILHDLAWAQYSVGHVAEASTAMRSALQSGLTGSQSEDAKRFLAFISAGEQPSESIVSEAKQVLSTETNYVPALMVCAADDERGGDFKQAAQIYERALAKYPAFAPAMRELAALYFERLDDDSKAYELGLKARAAFPDDSRLARTLGIISYRRGDYAWCEQLLNPQAQNAKGDAELLCCLGLAQYRRNEDALSKATLEQALALNAPAKLADEARKALAALK